MEQWIQSNEQWQQAAQATNEHQMKQQNRQTNNWILVSGCLGDPNNKQDSLLALIPKNQALDNKKSVLILSQCSSANMVMQDQLLYQKHIN